MLAIAVWCATSALDKLLVPLPLRIACAKVQYLGIAAAPPLWLLV